MPGETVLIISDDKAECRYFSDLFGFLEWTAICAPSIPAALRGLTTANVDMALLTENVQGLSLFRGLRILTEAVPHLPVVLVLPEDRISGFEASLSSGIIGRYATACDVDAVIQMLPSRRVRRSSPPACAPDAESLEVEFGPAEDVAILRSADRLDLIGHADLEEKLYALAEAGHTRIVLDLSGVTMLGSMSFAVLMRFWADLQQSGGRLVIACPTERASSCIRACNLDHLIEVCATMEEALEAASRKRGRSERLEPAVTPA